MSNMPPYEQVRSEIRMTIKQVNVNGLPGDTALIAFDSVIGDERVPSRVILRKLEDETVAGYLPSKALWNEWDELVLIFYVSPSLPDRARPFAGGPVYIAVIDDCPVELEYDGMIRCFVDQIATPQGIKYIILFGEQQWSEIVVKE